MKRSLGIITLLLVLLFAVMPGAALAAKTPVNPAAGEDFQRVPPETVGLDSTALARAVNFATSRNAGSVRILRHGYLVATSGLDALTATVPNNLWSSTKGVVSVLTGRAIALGKLRLDDPISLYVPEADAAHGRITIRQLLTQCSGLQFSWAADLNPLLPDSVAQCLALPFVHEPGTYFEYAQTTCTLLAHAVENAVGQDLQDFAQAELFDPLGIPRSDWFWLRDMSGQTHGYAYLFMPPRDLPRLGQLMLQGGVWNGKRLLPASYVKEAGSASLTNPGYGFLLWSNEGDHFYTPTVPDREDMQRPLVASAPRDMYGFFGMLDQLIFVIPSWDMVIVRTGIPGNYDLMDPHSLVTAIEADWCHEFFRLVGRSITDMDIPDPGYYQPTDGITGLDFMAIADPTLIANGMAAGMPGMANPQAGAGSALSELGTLLEAANAGGNLPGKIIENLLETLCINPSTTGTLKLLILIR